MLLRNLFVVNTKRDVCLWLNICHKQNDCNDIMTKIDTNGILSGILYE